MVNLAESIGLAILVDPGEFTTKTMVLPCREPVTGIRVDYMFSWSEYARQAMARSRSIELDGALIRFASPEDLIIHKIIAGRPRDPEDVRLLLVKNSEVDFKYIDDLLHEFDAALGEGFGGRFQQVWQESRQKKRETGV